MPGRVEWDVIASTGERFSNFAPYVPAVSDLGVVAFQAETPGVASAVIVADGTRLRAIHPPGGARVTSHPDLNDAGETCFYAVASSGVATVSLDRDGSLQTVADTREGYAAIGPLGPTMSRAGVVAFRADEADGIAGVYTTDSVGTTAVADTRSGWAAFQGLPVATEAGAVVFRADRPDGTEGIYVSNGDPPRPLVETVGDFATLGRFPSVRTDGTVAFAAVRRDGGAGIFTLDPAGAVRVVQEDGAFSSYRGALISDAGIVVIIATPQHGELGIFTGPDPRCDRLLAIGDPLLGSTVVDLAANPVSINAAGVIAVRASLASGRQLILLADTTR